MFWKRKETKLQKFYRLFPKAEEAEKQRLSPLERLDLLIEKGFPYMTEYRFPVRTFDGSQPLNLFESFRGCSLNSVFLRERLKSFRLRAKEEGFILPLWWGADETGKIKISDFRYVSSLSVGGRPQFGKTTLLFQIILGLLFSCPPELLKLVLIDNIKQDLGVFGGLASFFSDNIGGNKKCSHILKYLMGEQDRRQKKFKRLGVLDAIEANELAYSTKSKEHLTPFIVVIIDESMLGEEDKEHLGYLLQHARGSGFRFIISLQIASAGNLGSIKNLFSQRASFSVGDDTAERVNLGVGGKGAINLPVGQYILSEFGDYPKIRATCFPYQLIRLLCSNIIKRKGFTWGLDLFKKK